MQRGRSVIYIAACVRFMFGKTSLASSFWATVCKTVRPMLSDSCLSVLSCHVMSVTFVHCGQTV